MYRAPAQPPPTGLAEAHTSPQLFVTTDKQSTGPHNALISVPGTCLHQLNPFQLTDLLAD